MIFGAININRFYNRKRVKNLSIYGRFAIWFEYWYINVGKYYVYAKDKSTGFELRCDPINRIVYRHPYDRNTKQRRMDEWEEVHSEIINTPRVHIPAFIDMCQDYKKYKEKKWI